jgi:alpha-tubulin suppressor-like RCC1 family protein
MSRLLLALVASSIFVGCGASAEDGARAAEANAATTYALSVGDAEACAISLGKVQCFVPGEAARVIEGLENVVEIASGHDHVCARRDDGAVFCFGENAWGQLGDGTTAPKTSPVRVAGLGRATSIAAGYGKSCATIEDGRLMCWGAQESDPHELLVDAKSALAPIAIEGVRSATKVTLGAYHGCALQSGGAVFCFGANYFGQLGDGTTAAAASAVAVKNVEGAIAIAGGTHHTCALLEGGKVSCWGADVAGQLGSPAVRGGSRSEAARIDGIYRATALAAGGDHTCVISDGKARCWGWNDRGQVAVGASLVVRAPTLPSKVGAISAIAASDTHTCAIKEEGAITCWGSAR